ncbi:MAG: class I SAM-dependent methyltransferase [Methylocella sp.]
MPAPTIPNPAPDTRHFTIKGLDLSTMSVLEIGPLTRPIVARGAAREVAYMDHVSTDGLRKKYATERSINIDDIVEVDFVAADGRIAANLNGMTFDLIVAAHVIEHVPDFIGWIREAARVLNPGGVLALTVPDKRYSLDVLRRLSPKQEVEQAYREVATRPGLWNVADFFLNVVKADTTALWHDPESANDFAPHHTVEHLERAISDWRKGGYVDCHAWVFTPDHFKNLIEWARDKFSLPVKPLRFLDTQPGNLEFYVQLEKIG